MRSSELECIHGVGHSGNVHGCDGCCAIIAIPAMEKHEQRMLEVFDEVIDHLWHKPSAGADHAKSLIRHNMRSFGVERLS